MADKKSFVMYTNWDAAISKMSDEQAGQLIKAIYAYQRGEDTEPDDPGIALVFALFRQKFEEDDQRYKDMCAKRSEAGRKGNGKRWSDSRTVANVANAIDESQEVASAISESQEVASVADTDNDTDNENDTDKTLKEKDKKKKNPIRHKYGEYKHVLLSDEDYKKLVIGHGEEATLKAISKVDQYCEQYGKHYANYYLTILKWGFEPDRRARSGTPPENPFDHTKEVMGWHIQG